MKLERKKFETEVGGKRLTLEVSSLAERANASVLAKYGETVVLVTAVMNQRDGTADYMPLRVDYEERFYAAGKIIGSRFIRREGRPSEDAILTGRLVDRTIRPLFDSRLRRDIQVVVTVLAFDEENDPDFVGLIAVSAALGISDIPWGGPVAGVRVAKIGGEFFTNPNNSATGGTDTNLEIFVAGVEAKINMVELGGKEAKEEDVLLACTIAQKEIDRLVLWQNSLIKEIGKPKTQVDLKEPDQALKEKVKSFLSGRLEEALFGSALTFYDNLNKLKEELVDSLAQDEKGEILSTKDGSLPVPASPAGGRQAGASGGNLKQIGFLFEEEVNELVHRHVIKEEKRPDGRKLDEVRELSAEVALFDRTHGSALFVRGGTQALAVVTLAPPGAEQLIETMEVTGKRKFMLHYNFPPYSVGEIGPFRGPGRREIGHGALAEKALRRLIPPIEEFPYTIRVVSEILSSNGSSSMATVCAGSLALMDAGVPVKKMAAGIAMGLMADSEGNYKILTDIQGPEDHHGDMDFKVAGTEDGITAMQLDVKFTGLDLKIIGETLSQARKARLEILNFMKDILGAPRPQLSRYVPAIIILTINPEKIGLVIGPGGKMINSLIKKFGLTTIDIEEDGKVYIAADDPKKAERAAEEVRGLTREFKVGEIIEGQVIKILEFGAIVDLGGGKDGMIHVSELKNGFVKNVDDVVKVGDLVRAKVIRADEDGRIGLSMKQI